MPSMVVGFQAPGVEGRIKEASFFGGMGFPPPAFAIRFWTADERKEERLLLSLEIPQHCPMPSNLSKTRLERLHVERFFSDRHAENPGESWDLIGPGEDPPDFQVGFNGEDVGLEHTRFTSASRRIGHDQFRRIRSALIEHGPVGFRHLRGHLVYFWCAPEERPGNLPRPGDADAIIESLEEYRIPPSPIDDNLEVPVPVVLPDLGVGGAAPWSFLAVPLLNQPSGFQSLLGFDVGVCLMTEHSAPEAVEEFLRLVTGHDRPGSNVLLVSVGSPDSEGWTYPTDQAIVDLALSPLLQCGIETFHIDRVFVHLWAGGRVVEIPVRRPA